VGGRGSLQEKIAIHLQARQAQKLHNLVMGWHNFIAWRVHPLGLYQRQWMSLVTQREIALVNIASSPLKKI
jgi:hypothetical protein